MSTYGPRDVQAAVMELRAHPKPRPQTFTNTYEETVTAHPTLAATLFSADEARSLLATQKSAYVPPSSLLVLAFSLFTAIDARKLTIRDLIAFIFFCHNSTLRSKPLQFSGSASLTGTAGSLPPMSHTGADLSDLADLSRASPHSADARRRHAAYREASQQRVHDIQVQIKAAEAAATQREDAALSRALDALHG